MVESIKSILEILKLFAETITAISTCTIVVKHIDEIKLFFFGTYTIEGKKVYGFTALHEKIIQQERIHNIVDAIAPDRKDEYLLNKDELAKFLLDNKIFTKVTR